MDLVPGRACIELIEHGGNGGPPVHHVYLLGLLIRQAVDSDVRIEDGRLLSVYDTDSSMYDDILGQALSEYSDHKLKVIAGSIQREQNAEFGKVADTVFQQLRRILDLDPLDPLLGIRAFDALQLAVIISGNPL